jgi:hypothetical protein
VVDLAVAVAGQMAARELALVPKAMMAANQEVALIMVAAVEVVLLLQVRPLLATLEAMVATEIALLLLEAQLFMRAAGVVDLVLMRQLELEEAAAAAPVLHIAQTLLTEKPARAEVAAEVAAVVALVVGLKAAMAATAAPALSS